MQPKRAARLARELIEDKKGEDPVILDVASRTTIAHYFVITHGNSPPHVKAIATNLIQQFKEKGVSLYHVEGKESGEWVLLDFGSVLVHVFHRDKREFYHLESLWGDAPRVA